VGVNLLSGSTFIKTRHHSPVLTPQIADQRYGYSSVNITRIDYKRYLVT